MTSIILRSILTTTFIVVCTHTATAQGGWVKEVGKGYARLSAQTLSGKTYYRADGTKADSAITIREVSAYAEVGIVEDLMATASVPLLRTAMYDGYATAYGPGDVSLGVRYALLKGKWPVSLGLQIDLPTGDAGMTVNSVDGLLPSKAAPLGDGETNLWLAAGVSHSFWPTHAYVSADLSYNVRGLTASGAIASYDDGKFTDQYRVMVKGGMMVVDQLWCNLAVYRLSTVGTPKADRFSFLGLGEGVEYDAWDVGVAYEISQWAISLNATGVFRQPRAIYGGAMLIAGLSYKW